MSHRTAPALNFWASRHSLFTFFLLLCTLIVCIGVICPGKLFAKLEDHLKKITDKGVGHQIKNVDFIYMINLDERPEKLASCQSQLRPYGIDPYRFSAINGRKLSRKTLNDVGVRYKRGMQSDLLGTCYPLDGGAPIHELIRVPGRTYFCHRISLGVLGCALSHLSVIQDAFDSGYNTIWVMEDDIAVVHDPNLISDYLDKLDQLVGSDGWDMLFTDQDTISNTTGDYVICLSHAPRPNFNPKNPGRFAERTVISNEFRKVGARYGTYSVIIRRSGVKKILDHVKRYKLFLPIDMEFPLPSDIRMYTVNKDIVTTQRWAPSDNR
jgi:GR25 family glycosyltransferase involved in LPS biosynthesis